MTVGAGWVGSSAVGETGQRWMSAAGPAIRVGVPFWMSGLVGKSKGPVVTIGTTGTRGFQYWGFSSGFAGNFGSISGDFSGRQITDFYTSTFKTVVLRFSGANTGSVIVVVNGGRYQFDSNGNGGYTNMSEALANIIINANGGQLGISPG